MDEEELEMRSDEIKRIVDDLHERGFTPEEILRKLMEYLGQPLSW